MPVKILKEPEPVSPLDLSLVIGNPRNRVSRVGIELEGAWKVLPEGAHLEHDGSVFRDMPLAGHRLGELPIGPIQPGAMTKFMKKYYPSKVDSTCGMHVHMSFENLRHYAWLMVPEYQETVISYLVEWAKKEGFPPSHHIYDRLAGNSIFCQRKFWPDAQVTFRAKDHDQHRHGHRYTIINYYGRLMTIECRVLPMMQTVEQAIRAVKFLLDITNASLVILGKRDNMLVGRKENRQVYTLDLPNDSSYKSNIGFKGGQLYEDYDEDGI